MAGIECVTVALITTNLLLHATFILHLLQPLLLSSNMLCRGGEIEQECVQPCLGIILINTKH